MTNRTIGLGILAGSPTRHRHDRRGTGGNNFMITGCGGGVRVY
ncbi:hypothetical protein [Micromonospora sp. NPDC005367]